MPSQPQEDERIARRFAAASILTKLAVYFLAFGLILLCTGGIRAMFFPANVPSKVLIIVGIIISSLGIVYTVIALAFIRSLGVDVTPSSLWNMGVNTPSRSHRRRRHRNIVVNNISGRVTRRNPRDSSPYSPDLVAAEEDLKYWEPPPSYETATRNPQVFPVLRSEVILNPELFTPPTTTETSANNAQDMAVARTNIPPQLSG